MPEARTSLPRVKDRKVYHGRGALDVLPATIRSLFDRGDRAKAQELILELGDGLLGEDRPIQRRIAGTLVPVIDDVVDRGHTNILLQLSHKLIVWLILEVEPTPAYRSICRHLRDLARKLILKKAFADTNHILETFNIIKSGKLKKDDRIRVLAVEALADVGTPDILDALLEEFRTDAEEKRKQTIDVMIYLGQYASGPLLTLLRESQDRYERSRTLQVLSYIGGPAVPAIIRNLKHESPWYYVRNMALLLGKSGNANHLSTLRPLLGHRDLRVQREALWSIHKLGGRKSESIVLSVLPEADNRLKGDIIEVLGDLQSRAAVSNLLEMLETTSAMETPLQEELTEKICTSLGKIGDPKAIPALNKILDRESKKPVEGMTFNERVKAAAASALTLLKEKMTQGGERRSLRKQNHFKIWARLYKTLTQEESEALFDALIETRYEEGRLVYRQGRLNTQLYLVDEGRAVLAYDQEGEEIWVKTLKPGDMGGARSFFSSSVHTTSMRAVTDLVLNTLERQALTALKAAHPELEAKLEAFCIKSDNIVTVLSSYGMERRNDPRAEVPAKVMMQFLDPAGKPEGRRYRGDVQDVSAGGLAMVARLTDGEVETFVGRRANIKTLLQSGREDLEIDRDAKVVAVLRKKAEIYTLHLKFDQRISPFPSGLLGRRKGSPEPQADGASAPEEFDKTKDNFLVTRLPE